MSIRALYRAQIADYFSGRVALKRNFQRDGRLKDIRLSLLPMRYGREHALVNLIARGGRRDRVRRMKSQAFFGDHSLHAAQAHRDLVDRSIVARNEYDRDAKRTGIGGVQLRFGHRSSIQRDPREMGARNSMSAHAFGVRRGGVVTDEYSGREARVKTRHHFAVTRPRTNDS